jgi:hypothetical protein
MSYTIRLKSTSIQMGKTSVINKSENPTANNQSDFNLVSLNVSDNLNLKYCSNLPGVLHTDISGNVISKLIDTSAMGTGSITSNKLASSINLSGIPTADTALYGTNTRQIATTAFVQSAISDVLGNSSLSDTLNSLTELAAAIDNDPDFVRTINDKIQPLRDVLDNKQPTTFSGFFHVTDANVSYDTSVKPFFVLSNKIRHIIDFPAKIFLPPITAEGVVYSLINKSGSSIVISTSTSSELIFNTFVAPDGDNDFDLGTNQCLEFISISTVSISGFCWQASYY